MHNLIVMNWKTSLAGIGALLVALGHIISSISGGGGISATDLMALSAAVGLLLAKDA